MMRKMEQSLKDRAEEAYQFAYYNIAGNMNRAERRTANGKLIEARAKIAALEAENKVLREQADI